MSAESGALAPAASTEPSQPHAQPQQADPLAIEPSKPLPAEHPSAPPTPRSRPSSLQHSATAPSSESPAQSPPKTQLTPDHVEPKSGRRIKSVSLSIPVLANQGYEHRRAASQSGPAQNEPAPISRPRASNTLRINIPSASDVNFLTALASQERHVLELKEQLGKAEQELGLLKSMWVSSESKKRQSEARGLHRMTSTSSGSATAPKPPAMSAPPTVESMYEEMARRKASIGEAVSTPAHGGERTPRRRFFSGSRQLRALSLATPPIFETAEHQDSEQRGRAISTPNQLDGLSSASPGFPATPDLIEEEEDTDPSSSSAYSSNSPQRKPTLRSSMRSSIQMAAEFREGLWTFFEDLKQATYGEEARAQEARIHEIQKDAILDTEKEFPMPPFQHKPSPTMPARRQSASKKQTIQRQTWQFRPSDAPIDVPLADNTSFWEEQGVPDAAPVDTDSTPNATLRKEKSQSSLKVGSSGIMEHDGETWDNWDSPKRGRSPAGGKAQSPMPSPAVSKSRRGSQSTATTARKSSSNETLKSKPRPARASDAHPRPAAIQTSAQKEEFRRDSMAWPVLEKLKSGHISRGVNSLLDDWERSLQPPDSPRSPGVRSQLGSVSPGRPMFQRSNSRLDNVYQ